MAFEEKTWNAPVARASGGARTRPEGSMRPSNGDAGELELWVPSRVRSESDERVEAGGDASSSCQRQVDAVEVE